MTQIIRNGPDIPPHLLHAHERGEVVFFCGAGISRPRLPLFKDLVKGLYDGVNMPLEGAAKEAFDNGYYDVAVGLLESESDGVGRPKVLQTLAGILATPADAHSATHSTLLNLARCPDNKIRLVTTNFDRLFESAIGKKEKRHNAPYLPLEPKGWGGVVYLHGVLPAKKDGDVDHLVISSADFGRAYMTHQWATRFVNALLNNYTVCFVGYGVNDPAMRYLTTARATDNSGKDTNKMYAFVDCAKGEETKRREEWRAKGITPILYNKGNNHAALHGTLREWANVHRHGKRIIVDRYAMSPPQKSDDNFVSEQMMWAVADPHAATYFANYKPVPPIEWLDVFSARYDENTGGNLWHFGISPSLFKRKQRLTFSVLDRPVSGQSRKLIPWTGIASRLPFNDKLDEGMGFLGQWLLRHMHNRELILWIAEQGGHLHPEFAEQAKWRLDDMSNRSDAPDIPSPPMQVLWHLLLAGRIGASERFWESLDFQQHLSKQGLTFSLRSQLREMLSPCVKLGELLPWDNTEQHAIPKHAIDIVNCEIDLRLSDARNVMPDAEEFPHWKAAMPPLLDDFTSLLRDVLDMMRELGKASDRHDGSYVDMPSIGRHGQNTYNRDWTLLVDYARDAWLATKENDPVRARRVAEEWQRTPYPLFKRLAFFAAKHHDIIPTALALEWLLADNGWWLWTEETRRETIRLMVAIAGGLNPHSEEMRKLTSAIIKRPPREMYEQSATEDAFDYAEWLLLAKIREAGIVLNEAAQAEFDALSTKHTWTLAKDDRDEFPVWMGDVGFSHSRPVPRGFVPPPRKASELAVWLKKPPLFDGFHNDSDIWRQYCRDNSEETLAAFGILAREKCFPAERWGDALHAWDNAEFAGKSWQAAAMLTDAETEVFQNHQAAHLFASWLKEQGQNVPEQDGELFLRLCRCVITMGSNDQLRNANPLQNANYDPVGRATEGLLRWFSHQENPQLPPDVRGFLTLLCNTDNTRFRSSRFFLAMHALDLFGIDEEWAKQTLLPLFDWNKSPEEARTAWYGFLSFYRATPALFREIKHFFLDTAKHADELGKMGRKYANVLTWLALETGDEMFSPGQFSAATGYLSEEGLCCATDTIIRRLKKAGENRGQYWRDRVSPYFKWVWPPQKKKVTKKTAEQIAKVCIAAEDSFADAMNQLEDFLVPVGHPGRIYHGYLSSELCAKFPKEALRLIAAITGDGPIYTHGKLREYLDAIRQARPELADTPEFIRLKKLCE